MGNAEPGVRGDVATDYHYIWFNVGRGNGWMWEAWNGQLRPFYN